MCGHQVAIPLEIVQPVPPHRALTPTDTHSTRMLHMPWCDLVSEWLTPRRQSLALHCSSITMPILNRCGLTTTTASGPQDPTQWNPTPQLRPLAGQQFKSVAAAVAVPVAPTQPYVPWTGQLCSVSSPDVRLL